MVITMKYSSILMLTTLSVSTLTLTGCVILPGDWFKPTAKALTSDMSPTSSVHRTETTGSPLCDLGSVCPEFSVDWKYYKSAVEAVDELKKKGYIVYSIEQVENSISFDTFNPDINKKYAIVMGNEVKGVQQEVIDHSDGCLELPQYGTKHSLNVSVTAGIVIWEMFVRMKPKW